jgi:fibronectin-binding autotransporter adhesin
MRPQLAATRATLPIRSRSASPRPVGRRRALGAGRVGPLVVGVALVMAISPGVRAGTTWDGGGGNTNWSTAANWDGDTLPTFGSTTTLTFGAAGPTATLDSNRTVGTILFNYNGSFTINGSSTLTLYNGVTSSSSLARSHTISVPVNLASTTATFDIDSDDSVTLSNVVSGASAVTMSDFGLLRLSGVNSYTGKTTIPMGTVEIAADRGLGQAPASFVADQLKLGGSPENWAGKLKTTSTFSLSANRGINMVQSGVMGVLYVGASTTLTVPAVISGPGGLSVTSDFVGGGTLVLSAANTYSGRTYIGDGATLRLSGAGRLPISTDLTVEGPFDLNGINQTIDELYLGDGWISLGSATLTVGNSNGSAYFRGAINGSGGLTKIGYGTQTLGGANTYTGPTLISAGVLALTSGGSLSDSTDVTVTGGFDLAGVSDTIDALSGAGSVMLGSATLTVGGNNGGGDFSGAISGTGGFTKIGSGTQILSGANTYTGRTLISAGKLQLVGAGRLSDSTDVTVTGTFDLNGTSDTVDALSGAGSVTLGSGTLTIGGNNGGADFSGAISGAGGLIKTGSGTQTLSGTNGHTGGTVVAGGTLQASTGDALGAPGGNVTINPGATLAVAAGAFNLTANALLVNGGTLSGNLTVGGGAKAQGSGVYGPVVVSDGGVFSPGASVGTATTATATCTTGGKYLFEIKDADGTAGADWDLWNVAGDLVADSSPFTVAVATFSGSSPGAMADFDNAQPYAWLIASATGVISGIENVALDASLFQNALAPNGRLRLALSGNQQLYLRYSLSVPGDATGDGEVDEEDATTLAGHWGQSGGWSDGNFNNDGVVNAADASILAANWGHGTSEAGAVPEPGIVISLVCGAIAGLIGWRRRR